MLRAGPKPVTVEQWLQSCHHCQTDHDLVSFHTTQSEWWRREGMRALASGGDRDTPGAGGAVRDPAFRVSVPRSQVPIQCRARRALATARATVRALSVSSQPPG